MPDIKQTIGTKASGVQANEIGAVNINVNASKGGIPKNLTLLPAKNPNFVGRKTELQQIVDDLASDSMVYIVNGIGGIGKSELAYKYLLENKDNYQHIALFEFSDTSDTLEDILIAALKQSLFLDDNITLERILYRLQQLQEKCLLVFDNLKNTDDIKKLSCLNSNCDVLITTRLNIPAHKCLNLEILPPDDARALFLSHYPTDKNIDDILEYIDYHSLFIELIAKTVQEGCLSLEELRQKFQSGDFAKIDRSFEQSFNDFLIQRFQIEDNEALKKQLQLLALLPSVEIKRTTLEEIFNNDTRLKPKLSELAKRGWLIQKEGNYKLHQIIKEFILANHPISFDTASPIMQGISKQLDPNDAYLNPNEKTYFIESIESILEQFSTEKNTIIATLQDSLCNLYFALGQYNKAQKIQQIALNTRKELLGKKHPDTATSYNNIASVYRSQGNYSKALALYQKALTIREEVLGKKHPDTATTYNNIAGAYESKGNHSKALALYQKALTIAEKVMGKKHPNTAASYNNIAVLYNNQENYPKALALYQKALTIIEEVLGKKHPKTATSYNNIALVYNNQENYPKALALHQKALTIQEEVLGEKHPDMANSYHNIATVYLKQKYCNKALTSAEKALSIYQALNLDNKIPNTQDLLKLIKRNIKKAKKMSLRRRARVCKDRDL